MTILKNKKRDTTEFRTISEGTAFETNDGRVFMKLSPFSVLTERRYPNAVNLDDGEVSIFSDWVTVTPLYDAVLMTEGLDK